MGIDMTIVTNSNYSTIIVHQNKQTYVFKYRIVYEWWIFRYNEPFNYVLLEKRLK